MSADASADPPARRTRSQAKKRSLPEYIDVFVYGSRRLAVLMSCSDSDEPKTVDEGKADPPAAKAKRGKSQQKKPTKGASRKRTASKAGIADDDPAAIDPETASVPPPATKKANNATASSSSSSSSARP